MKGIESNHRSAAGHLEAVEREPKATTTNGTLVIKGERKHTFPSRTRSLSSQPPMVVRPRCRARVGRCQYYEPVSSNANGLFHFWGGALKCAFRIKRKAFRGTRKAFLRFRKVAIFYFAFLRRAAKKGKHLFIIKQHTQLLMLKL